MIKSIQEELQELSSIPILENELIWICRVTDEKESKDLPNSHHSETTE